MQKEGPVPPLHLSNVPGPSVPPREPRVALRALAGDVVVAVPPHHDLARAGDVSLRTCSQWRARSQRPSSLRSGLTLGISEGQVDVACEHVDLNGRTTQLSTLLACSVSIIKGTSVGVRESFGNNTAVQIVSWQASRVTPLKARWHLGGGRQ